MKKITLLFFVFVCGLTKSFGQLSQGFEGVWPPAGWTIIATNQDYTWTTLPGAINGSVSAYVPYNFDQDESLISPAFTVPVGSPELKFTTELSYFWAVDPNNNYNLLVSISIDGGVTWTQLWSENDLGVFENWEDQNVVIPLTAYAGSTNAKIKFQYVGDDGADLLLDDISVDVPPTAIPGCAANAASVPNATCGNYLTTLSWSATSMAEGYNLSVGTSSGGTDILNNVDIDNVLTYDLVEQSPGTTYYWKIVPYNSFGPATGCTENTYSTFATPCFCVSVPESVDNDGVTDVLLGSSSFTSSNDTYIDNTSTVVNLTQGIDANLQITFATEYSYDTNVWIDFNNDSDFNDAGELVKTDIASTDESPTTLDASFALSVTAPLGQHRLRIGTADSGQIPPDPCYTGTYGVTLDFTVNIVAPAADLPDYYTLQYPYTATFIQGGSVVVYGQVYEGGLTDVPPYIVGQAPGIQAWVGYSSTDTNPNTWTNWVPATWNSFHDNDNNDEYQATIGANLFPGTYYYATRFQLNTGAYVYGGINSGAWDTTNHPSGILTVTPFLVTGDCELDSTTPDDSVGEDIWTRPVADGSGLSGAGIDVSYHVYGPFTVDTTGSYTITSTQTFDGVIFIYENSFSPLDQLTNYVAGNDDSNTNESEVTTNLTTGTDYYLITTGFEPGEFGDYTTIITGAGAATCTDLGVPVFNANFNYYPNPVKNILNLSYDKEISNVDIFNLLGQKVSSTNIHANTAQIDMSYLSKGAYMVKVTSNDQIKTIKVIKE